MGFGETSLQAVLFHCPHSTSGGVMFPVDVSTVLTQQPLPTQVT